MIDQVKVFIQSGNGGDGAIAFRREKFVPHGGPAGGDGGDGGDIIFRVNPKMNTLAPFGNRIHFRAQHGEKGGTSNKAGADGNDVIVDVPPGTVIRRSDNEQIIADLVRPGESVIVAKGGRGGRGNARFASAANQAPRIADKGEPGVEMWVILELRLIADVGIAGVPNAGKSTLLSVISNARPKIADYPFTTLEPNLGVVTLDMSDLVVADIPGLVEGAHMGIGLGHAFLRHVTRTRMLIHLLNGAADDPIADYNQINAELSLYDERLGQKPQIVVVSKLDMPEVQARWEELEAALKSRGVENPMAISSFTRQNIQKLIGRMFEEFSKLPESEPFTAQDMPLYELPPEDEAAFTIEKLSEGAYRVSGKRIERAAERTYWDYEEAVYRFQKLLDTLGVTAALRQAGVREGDSVYIGENELEWSD